MNQTKKEKMWRPSRMGRACQCKFMRYFTRKHLAPCLCNVGWALLIGVALFLLNAGLIMSYSYAFNGLSYNMSTGCLFTSLPSSCNQTLTFYAHSGVAHLMGWSTALSLTELLLLLVILAIAKFILNYCHEGYADYRQAMVDELPSVPTLSYREDFSIDDHPSEDDSDSL